MRHLKNISIIIILSILILSCATLTEKYKGATEDEKVRLQLSALQSALDSAFDGAKIYVAAHPEKIGDWKTKVLPMFGMANKILYDLILDGKAGKPLTAVGVTGKFMDKTVELRAILTIWGVTL